MRKHRFIPLCALAMLLVSSTGSAFAQANDHPNCAVKPVTGFDGVFIIDLDNGLGPCAPATWVPALVILRGQANAGEGESLKNIYLNGGGSMPQYVLVAAEACVQCGEFAVLVPGKRSGEHWNTAVAAAHALQKSKPTPAGSGGPDHPLGPWIFLGMEPQPVSAACLTTLPGDPCWGSEILNANWEQPVASSSSDSTQVPVPGAPTALPTLNGSGPPSTPPGPAASANTVTDFSGFVGTWQTSNGQLEVHDDGSASLVFDDGVPGDEMDLMIQFSTDPQANDSRIPVPALQGFVTIHQLVDVTGGVVVSDNDNFPVGRLVELDLNDNDSVSVTLGPNMFSVMCGPQAPDGLCP